MLIPTSIRISALVFVLAVLVFVLGPLIAVIGVSFTAGDYISFPPQGLSLRWYEAVLRSPVYLSAAWTSLSLAILVTISATIIGAASAIALHRRKLPGTTFFAALFMGPMILPTIIFALGLLMLWTTYFGQTSFYALWLGHTVIAIPYVVRTTLAVLSTTDPFLEEAARTMGAGPWKALVSVMIPQCMPGLAAGAFFAFNISFDEAILSLFLRGPDLVTLPIQIYTQLEFSPDPSIAAVSALLIGMTVFMIFMIDRIVGIQRVAG